MNLLSTKIIIPSKFIELSYKDNWIVVNSENVASCKLSQAEYEIFKKVIELKESDQTEFEKHVDTNEDANKLVFRLVVSRVFPMKNNNKKSTMSVVHYDAYWGLTEQCNFRCIYCYAKCGPEVKPQKDTCLTIDQCYKVVDEVKGMGFESLVLTGGEPMLNENVFKIARYAKSVGLKIGILTNGSLITEKNVTNFKIFDFIKISLDSHIPELNDKGRGKGSFEKIIRGLNLLKEHNLPLMIGSVISNYNKDTIDDLIYFVQNEYKTIDHTLTTYIPLGRGKDNPMACSFEELEKVNKVVFDTKRELKQKNIGLVAKDAIFTGAIRISCGMAAGEIFINYKGDVYPCRMTYSPEFFLGNIFEKGLKESLDSFEKIGSQFVVDEMDCKNCNYKYLCGGGCRMYHQSYTGEITKSHPKICEQYKTHINNLLLMQHKLL